MYLLDHIGVLEAFEEGDLSDCRGGHAVVLLLQSDLLEGHILASDFILRFIHNSVSSFTQLLKFLVTIDVVGRGSDVLADVSVVAAILAWDGC